MLRIRFDWLAVMAGLFAASIASALAGRAVDAGFGIITIGAFAVAYYGVLVAIDRGWIK